MDIESYVRIGLEQIDSSDSELLQASVLRRIQAMGKGKRRLISRSRPVGATLAAACAVLLAVGGILAARQGAMTASPKPLSQKTLQADLISLLPKGSRLLPYKPQTVALFKMGKSSLVYGAVFQNVSGGSGVALAQSQKGKLSLLWTNTAFGVPSMMSNPDLLHNGEHELVLIEGSPSVMTTEKVDVLRLTGTKVVPILTGTASQIDKGNWRSGSTMTQFAFWNYGYGGMYNIHMYQWSGSKGKYVLTPNERFPLYFKQYVVPYYTNQLYHGKPVNRSIAYGLSEALYDAGQYKASLNMINDGMRIPWASQFPTNKEFTMLQNMVRSKMKSTN